MLNIPQNIFVGQLVSASQGPVITMQVYDEKTFTHLDVYSWEVFNGARLVPPLPFGMFGEISQINMNKSRLTLKIAPGFLEDPTNPIFDELTELDVNYDKYLSNGNIIRKVVPVTFPVNSIERTDFWDIKLVPLDATHAILEKIYVDSPPVQGQETRRDLYASLQYTEEIISADQAAVEMAAGGNPNVEYTPVDVFHTLKRIGVVPTNAMNNFLLRYPTRFNLDLPRVLKSVNVLWNTNMSIGTQDTAALDHADGTSGSVSLSIPDSASSAAACSAEIQLSFEEYATQNLYLETLIFYMPPPITKDTIIAKINAIYGLVTPLTVGFWPVFRPKSETITVLGQSVAVRANCQVAMHESWSTSGTSYGWTTSVSDDFSIATTNNSVQTPPCIHGEIVFTGTLSQSLPVTATAAMNITSSHGTGVSATKSKIGTASGSTHPIQFSPTSGADTIPTGGYYIMDIDVKPYDFGWFQVRADVFNAASLT